MSGAPLGNPQDYNPKRQEGCVDVEGVQDAVQDLSTDGVANDGHPPSTPESGVQHASNDDRRHVSTITQPPGICCPVPKCNYRHSSSSGLCAHIGGKQDYAHNWDRIDVSPADLHELDDRGHHPDKSVRSLLSGEGDSRVGTDDYLAVKTVRAWLVRQGQPIDKLHVYVAPQYDSVQIQPRAYLGGDWDAYQTLMQETDGIFYDWDNERNYCADEFVDGLSASKLGV